MQTDLVLPLRAVLGLVLAAGLHAQEPQVAPLRLDAGTKIDVDGVLDEAFWARAPHLGDLTVTAPVEGAQPTYPTEVLLAYDSDAFYIGIVCHDDPTEVRARQMDRDAFVRYDDVVELWFDTFHDRRFGFWFQMTAAGSRGDGLLADSGSSFNKSWDGIWYGRSRVTADGWVAEMKLPFKTLAFREGASTWGFNLRRKRIANGEDARWASPSVAYDFFNLAEGGVLVGMTGMEQGLGLDVTPYVRAGVGRNRDEDPAYDYGDDFDAGLDLAWRPTSSTTVRVTTNTDFAETEVDDRQVNLSRFPLFFPEKRDFFLEDAGLFEFGPSGRGGGVRPFFSRTIGRDPDGGAVPILAGTKFTGRMGDWNVGVLETRVDGFTTDDTGLVGERSLGVLRLSRNLGEQNSAGLIFTHGDPQEGGRARTYGADFRLGSSRLFGEGHSGSLWGYYVESDNEGQKPGAAYGVQAETRSSVWEHTAQAYVTEESYDPRLGFVRRTGVEHYRYRGEYTWRGGPGDIFRRYQVQVSPHYDQDTAGQEDRFTLPLTWLDLQFQSQDSISIETEWFEEQLDDGFDLSDDVTVGAGLYDGVTHTVEFEGNERRILTGKVRVEFGDFFGGDLFRWKVEPVLIPSKYFTLRVGYEDIQADFAGPDLDTQLYSTDIDFGFNPDLSLRNVLQYDTQTEDLAWQGRLHWIIEPGQDLFLVVVLGWDRTDRDSFHGTNEEMIVKLSYTWRF
ncbi:MAG: hypothetical protein ACI8QZ_003741 [Chlamydiales bacterium]